MYPHTLKEKLNQTVTCTLKDFQILTGFKNVANHRQNDRFDLIYVLRYTHTPDDQLRLKTTHVAFIINHFRATIPRLCGAHRLSQEQI